MGGRSVPDQATAASWSEQISTRAWFMVYDLANAMRWPFLRWAKRWTRTELWLIRLSVYAQGRGFGWND